MALSLSDLQARRDELTQMISGNVIRVRVEDADVEYGNIDELVKRRAYIDAEIAKLTPTAPPSYSFAQFSKDGRGNSRNG